jgi:hypothetical protein
MAGGSKAEHRLKARFRLERGGRVRAVVESRRGAGVLRIESGCCAAALPHEAPRAPRRTKVATRADHELAEKIAQGARVGVERFDLRHVPDSR